MNKLLVAMAFVPASLFAVDGVTLINQSIVTAAGGFPYTITQPGSYKLSGNLSVPTGLTAIYITVPKVTIDLNGFSITGINSSVTTFGIQYTGAATPNSIVIRGGTIDGFTFPIALFTTAQVLCQSCALTDLVLRVPFGFISMDLGNWTRIQNVTALNASVSVICPSVVVNSVAILIIQHAPFPGDPNPPNAGTCTFANNATIN
jgi:hypothetical protein